MFERLNTPQEAYNRQLGSALKMENTVLDMLGDLMTRLRTTAQADVPPPPGRDQAAHLQAIEKEGKANIEKTDDSIVDSIILGAKQAAAAVAAVSPKQAA